jgi:hypothetical protein
MYFVKLEKIYMKYLIRIFSIYTEVEPIAS